MPKGEKKKLRLKDIDVEEVSLVDIPANQEPFLVIKRQKSQEGDDHMERKKVTQKDGVAAADTDTTPVDASEIDGTTENAEVTPPADSGAKETGAADGAGNADDQTKEVLKSDDALTGVVKKLMDTVESLTGLMKSVIDKLPTAKQGKAEGESSSDAEGVEKVGAKTPSTPPPTAPAADGTEAGTEETPAETTGETAPAEDVEKAGAKVSKARLAKIRNAFNELSTLLKELEGVESAGGTAPVKKDADGVEESVTDEIKTIAKSVEGLASTVTEFAKSLEEAGIQTKQPGEGGTEQPVEKKGDFWDGAI